DPHRPRQQSHTVFGGIYFATLDKFRVDPSQEQNSAAMSESTEILRTLRADLTKEGLKEPIRLFPLTTSGV
ncbi:MAG: hypothetical protein ACRCVE_07275, partial [Plesiomonas sp.]